MSKIYTLLAKNTLEESIVSYLLAEGFLYDAEAENFKLKSYLDRFEKYPLTIRVSENAISCIVDSGYHEKYYFYETYSFTHFISFENEYTQMLNDLSSHLKKLDLPFRQ